jgi:hypothetical protein
MAATDGDQAPRCPCCGASARVAGSCGTCWSRLDGAPAGRTGEQRTKELAAATVLVLAVGIVAAAVRTG